MKLDLRIIGSNSALPSHNRFPSAQLLSCDGIGYLIDCGEGTQIKMAQLKVKRSKIQHIFISHLHGDHIFGLPGLLTSYALQGRESKLTVHGPIGIKRYLNTVLEVSESFLPYELFINEFEVDHYKVVFEDVRLSIYSLPLQHRIATSGYIFEEKNAMVNLDPAALSRHKVTVDQLKQLQSGEQIMDIFGKEISLDDVILKRKMKRKYAYCSDTVYDESIIEHIESSTLLYHEATYLDNMKSQAAERMHSTARQAALIAKKSNVQKLVIGHFSSRYKDLNPLLEEAKEFFEETYLALEGEIFEI